jgi:hypothetical protein
MSKRYKKHAIYSSKKTEDNPQKIVSRPPVRASSNPKTDKQYFSSPRPPVEERAVEERKKKEEEA